jgi:hypothetical protein
VLVEVKKSEVGDVRWSLSEARLWDRVFAYRSWLQFLLTRLQFGSWIQVISMHSFGILL